MVLPNGEFAVMSLGSLLKRLENLFISCVGRFIFLILSLLLTQGYVYLDILCATVFSTYIVSSVDFLINELICYCKFNVILRLFLFTLETRHYFLISLFSRLCRWGTDFSGEGNVSKRSHGESPLTPNFTYYCIFLLKS